MANNGGLGYMAAEEFLETFTYMFAYDQSKDFIKNYFPRDPNGNPYIEEAKESAVQLVTFAGIFKIIQFEEQLLEKLFNFVSAVVAGLLLISKKGIDKLKNTVRKGRIFQFMQGLIKQYGDDALQKAQLLLQWLQAYITGRSNSSQAGNLVQASQGNRQNVVERDRSAMTMGKGMADNYVNSLMFKLFTSSFTANDTTMIKRILGRDASTELNVDDMNKIGSFMFTTDINGNLTGLTEQFFQLLNGQGYIHKTPVQSTP
ncbi:MAG: hypothetical protein Q8R86_09680 [Sulfuricurvum sp.]|nr:hypothetical protein [Sulfuricurvum sp.]